LIIFKYRARGLDCDRSERGAADKRSECYLDFHNLQILSQGILEIYKTGILVSAVQQS